MGFKASPEYAKRLRSIIKDQARLQQKNEELKETGPQFVEKLGGRVVRKHRPCYPDAEQTIVRAA